ncbi:hypothetical protein ES288_A08G024300v1 [Gossypium darwinii]|uniref:Secreted protein n=2 Tax=Gossypium TaxID=3633 RepID=A0A5D2P972_GOSTO|nr:hypothetical protein ES288_A08G024300v1 [Gossypium darwinii]TYI12931.1 hypothetical protein ES332_A08G023400v1 [Gossypium tomentosum]
MVMAFLHFLLMFFSLDDASSSFPLIFMVIFPDASSSASTSLTHRIDVSIVENEQQISVSILDKRYQNHDLSIDTFFLVSIPRPKYINTFCLVSLSLHWYDQAV